MKHPHLYEANARVFLRRMSEQYGRKLTLSSIPEKVWLKLKNQGFDFIWLMGAWRKSPGARLIALSNPAQRRVFSEALPDWNEKDVIGSPYAIYDYSLDPALGEPQELAELKKQLNGMGLKLILDFVPNHFAFDHPWTAEHPERFVHGNKHQAKARPDWFFPSSGGTYLAHGRDPHFHPWIDTVQVNFFSEDLRQALAAQLLQISEYCDGLRCDMAMLALTQVFEEVWGEWVKRSHKPAEEFWSLAIRELRAKRPDFIFLAEVYWDLEWKLQELGFDFTYDKPFYDRLRFFAPQVVREHLKALPEYQNRSVRFIENHDESRAPVTFGRERSSAAAIVISTVRGLRFFHDGQLEGRTVRLPVQLKREPAEKPDQEITAFYDRLLAVTSQPLFHDGEWKLLDMCQAWNGNESHLNFLVWSWTLLHQFKIVVVNYSAVASQGKLFLSLPSTTTASSEKISKSSRAVVVASAPTASPPSTTTASPPSTMRDSAVFKDEFSGKRYVRDIKEMKTSGLYIELGPWAFHVLSLVTQGADQQGGVYEKNFKN